MISPANPFRRISGITPTPWIPEILLVLNWMAVSTGYADQSHFIRGFKEFSGGSAKGYTDYPGASKVFIK